MNLKIYVELVDNGIILTVTDSANSTPTMPMMSTTTKHALFTLMVRLSKRFAELVATARKEAK